MSTDAEKKKSADWKVAIAAAGTFGYYARVVLGAVSSSAGGSVGIAGNA